MYSYPTHSQNLGRLGANRITSVKHGKFPVYSELRSVFVRIINDCGVYDNCTPRQATHECTSHL